MPMGESLFCLLLFLFLAFVLTNSNVLVFVLFYFISKKSVYFLLVDRKRGGSGWEKRWTGSGRSRALRNHNWETVCEGKKSVFSKRKKENKLHP